MRRSTLPAAATDYKAELPADFKVPDGVQRLEKMVSKITGQGGASFRGNGRDRKSVV